MDVLHCSDQFELLVIQAVTQRVLDLRGELDEALAARIANAVGKMLGG